MPPSSSPRLNLIFALCREFLEAGKDVFVEKPLTLAAGGVQATGRIGRPNRAHPASRPHFPLRSGDAMASRRHADRANSAGQHLARPFRRIQTPAQRQRRHVRRRHSFCRFVQLFSQRHPAPASWPFTTISWGAAWRTFRSFRWNMKRRGPHLGHGGKRLFLSGKVPRSHGGGRKVQRGVRLQRGAI